MASVISARRDKSTPGTPPNSGEHRASIKRKGDNELFSSPSNTSKPAAHKYHIIDPSAASSASSTSTEYHNSMADDNLDVEPDSDHDDDQIGMNDDNASQQYIIFIKAKEIDTNIAQRATAHPIKFKTDFEQTFGKPLDLQIHHKNRCLKVLCANAHQHAELLQALFFMGIAIEASLPRNQPTHRNTGTSFGNTRQPQCQAIIHNVPIELNINEIQFETEAVKAYRLTRIGLNGREPTKSVILSFYETPPEFVKIGYLRLRTNPYIPNPIRCNKCQKMNHTTARCTKATSSCSYCAQNHEYANCDKRIQNQPPKCANCNGQHSAAFRGCPIYVEIKQALSIRTTEAISYKEALLKVRANSRTENTTPNSTDANSTAISPQSATDHGHQTLIQKISDLEVKFQAMQGCIDAQQHQILSLIETSNTSHPTPHSSAVALNYDKHFEILAKQSEQIQKNIETMQAHIIRTNQQFFTLEKQMNMRLEKLEATPNIEAFVNVAVSNAIKNLSATATPAHTDIKSLHPKPPTKPNNGKTK